MSELALLGGAPAVTVAPPLWPQLGEPEIAALQQAFEALRRDTSYLNSMPGEGPVAAFEAHMRAYYDRRYAVASNSCAAALQMALFAAGVGAGDEVVVSPYTWGQSVSPILNQLAIPIFADIDPESYCLKPAAVEAAISERTKAILVVHLYGHPADLGPLGEIARRHGVPLIEDCAQAMGAKYEGRQVGTFGDLACFSFGDAKQITGGDGGCVITDDETYHARLVEIGSHPLRQQRDIKDSDSVPYIDSLTYTFRMHPLAAVIVDRQLDFLAQWNNERRANHHRLNHGLSDLPWVQPVTEAPETEHCYHRYCPTYVPEESRGVTRETFVRAVAAEGAPLTLGYVRKPIHLRPRFQHRRYFFGDGLPWSLHPRAELLYQPGDCPEAERRCAETELDLFYGSALRGDQTVLIDQYVDAFHKVWEGLDALRDWQSSQAAG